MLAFNVKLLFVCLFCLLVSCATNVGFFLNEHFSVSSVGGAVVKYIQINSLNRVQAAQRSFILYSLFMTAAAGGSSSWASVYQVFINSFSFHPEVVWKEALLTRLH